jgi:phosphoglycolate phosphatase
MSRSLILFDIDGTLVSGCGEGIEPFVRAIRDVSGIRIAAGFHDTAGKTDRLILRELLQHQGVTPEQTEEARMLRRYLEHVRALILEKPGRILPGVRMFLQRLGREEHFNIGLGTGNLEAAARLKLRLHGLDEFFETGGFGDDALYRKDVIAAGIRKAQRRYGIDFERVIVVGDTPRDIEASKAIGVYSVAVATGSYLFSELRTHNPTILIRDMSEPEMIIEQLQSKAR